MEESQRLWDRHLGLGLGCAIMPYAQNEMSASVPLPIYSKNLFLVGLNGV
jgi:hypothetical protein